jgi:hypothetical protein
MTVHNNLQKENIPAYEADSGMERSSAVFILTQAQR